MILLIESTIECIAKNKIIAIARNVPLDKIISVGQALYDGGIRLIEVTFNQSSSSGMQDTKQAIKVLCDKFGDKLCIGAGTVMSVEQAQIAYDAGAKYLISPNVDVNVIKKTNDLGIVSIPGALTPSEIAIAYNAGAHFVKLFPAGTLGIDYIKAVMAPINYIPMLAVGGVDEKNIKDFLNIGLKGVGVGSNIVNNKLINEGKFEELTKLAKLFTQVI